MPGNGIPVHVLLMRYCCVSGTSTEASTLTSPPSSVFRRFVQILRGASTGEQNEEEHGDKANSEDREERREDTEGD